MNAGAGGFAAALYRDPVWVMNVVPVEREPSTMGQKAGAKRKARRGLRADTDSDTSTDADTDTGTGTDTVTGTGTEEAAEGTAGGGKDAGGGEGADTGAGTGADRQSAKGLGRSSGIERGPEAAGREARRVAGGLLGIVYERGLIGTFHDWYCDILCIPHTHSGTVTSSVILIPLVVL